MTECITVSDGRLDFTNGNRFYALGVRPIRQGEDWAFSFTLTAQGITVITEARMEIRKRATANSPIIASFYSDGTGTGTLTISSLVVSISLPGSVTADDAFTFVGDAMYDIYINNRQLCPLHGDVDINARVTE